MHFRTSASNKSRTQTWLITCFMVLAYGFLNAGDAPAFNIVSIAHPKDCGLGGLLTEFLPSLVTDIGKSHKEITEDAIRELDNDRYGPITDQMEKAIEFVVLDNIFVDAELGGSAPAHVDGETFGRAQARLSSLSSEVVEALKTAKDPFAARAKLGQALHTVQDFYAHSNWVNLGNSEVHPQFGRQPFNPISGLAGGDSPTCDSFTNGVLSTALLTTGYYGSSSGRAFIGTKCHHGGKSDTLVPPSSVALGNYAGINKDTTSTCHTPTSNHGLHAPAALLATKATRKFIEELEPLVGAAGLDLLLGATPLTFQNFNASSPVTVSIRLDSETANTVDLNPMQTFSYRNLPALFSGDTHTIVVRGLSSASVTGLIFYSLNLPTHLEFVSYSTNVSGHSVSFPIDGGQVFGNRLLLRPFGGFPEVEHRIKIRVVGLDASPAR